MENRHQTATTPTTQLGTVPVLHVPSKRRKPWQLTLWIDGKRRRTYHTTHKDALQAWKEHKRLERKWGTLPYLFDAEAQRRYDTAIRLLAGRASLEDAVRFYLAHAPDTSSPPLETAIAAFLAAKGKLGRSTRHMDDLRSRLASFGATIAPGTPVSAINQQHVAAWCLADGLAPRTSRNRRNAVRALWTWCRRRGMTTLDPVAALIDDDMPTPSKIAKRILSIEDARAILRSCRAHAPECLPWLAVQMFAGIRDAEAGRMTDSMLDRTARRIRMPAAITKTADDWVLQADLPDNLWAWLEPGPSTFLEPSSRRWQTVKRAANLADWPFNGARRSFCTYHISLRGDATSTAALLRHQSPARLYASYLGALRPREEAAAYFALTPDQL